MTDAILAALRKPGSPLLPQMLPPSSCSSKGRAGQIPSPRAFRLRAPTLGLSTPAASNSTESRMPPSRAAPPPKECRKSFVQPPVRVPVRSDRWNCKLAPGERRRFRRTDVRDAWGSPVGNAAAYRLLADARTHRKYQGSEPDDPEAAANGARPAMRPTKACRPPCVSRGEPRTPAKPSMRTSRAEAG